VSTSGGPALGSSSIVIRMSAIRKRAAGADADVPHADVYGGAHLWLKKRDQTAGILFGLMCLIKPQHSLFLVWFVPRKKFCALVSASLVVGLGWCIARALFG
jgi:hypothetical protein